MASDFMKLGWSRPDEGKSTDTCYGKTGEGGQEAVYGLFWPLGSLGGDGMTIFGVQVPRGLRVQEGCHGACTP